MLQFACSGFWVTTLKTYQMFSVHTTLENLKTQLLPVFWDLRLKKSWTGKTYDYRKVFVRSCITISRYNAFPSPLTSISPFHCTCILRSGCKTGE